MSSPAESAVAASSTVTSPPPGQGAPGGTRGGEEPELGNRELALGQDAAHDAADLSRCADDADAEPDDA